MTHRFGENLNISQYKILGIIKLRKILQVWLAVFDTSMFQFLLGVPKLCYDV